MKKVKIAIIGLSGQSIFMKVDNFHKNGETKHSQSLYIEPGGKGYNQAIACSRLGAEVYYLSAIGDDQYGKYCQEVIEKEGVNATFIKKKENTALATILTNNNGDNQVTVYKGASNKLNLNDLEKFKATIRQCNILLLQNEIPFDVLKEAMIYAKSNNVYVIYNPAPAIYDINSLLPFIDVIIPNEQEAITIYNKNIDDIINDSNTDIIVTLGSRGSMYISRNDKKLYPAMNVKVVDTTGAGDVFSAAIACKIKLLSIDETIKFATKASAKHIQKKYVIDAIPYIKDVL